MTETKKVFEQAIDASIERDGRAIGVNPSPTDYALASIAAALRAIAVAIWQRNYAQIKDEI